MKSREIFLHARKMVLKKLLERKDEQVARAVVDSDDRVIELVEERKAISDKLKKCS